MVLRGFVGGGSNWEERMLGSLGRRPTNRVPVTLPGLSLYNVLHGHTHTHTQGHVFFVVARMFVGEVFFFFFLIT